jgi:hypothetical protein
VTNETRRAVLVFVYLECRAGLQRSQRLAELERGSDDNGDDNDYNGPPPNPALVDGRGRALGDDAFVVVQEPILDAGRRLATLPLEIVREVCGFLPIRLLQIADYRKMTKPVLSFGEGVFGDPQFLSVDPLTGNVVVADTNKDRYFVCDPQTGQVVFESAQVQNCYSIACQSTGAVVANAKAQSNVEQYPAGAKKPTKSATTLKNPWGMCASLATDHIYVACPLDGDTTRIQEFSGDLELIRRLETKDDWPHDVAVDSDRQRLLSATTGGIVQIDLESGKYVNKVVTLSTLSRPMGIECDSDGTYLCVDQSGKKVGVFEPETHKLIHSIDISFMRTPVGIAICPLYKRIFVSDEGSKAVFVFTEGDVPVSGSEGWSLKG